MALQRNGLVVLKVLLIILLSSGGYTQRRVRLRRPSPVNYGRILSMTRNVLAEDIETVRNEFNEKLNVTKKKLDDALLEIKSLKEENREMRANNERLGDNLKQLIASANAEVELLEASNSELKDHVATLQKANVEIKGAINVLESSNSELTDMSTSLQAANDETNEDLQALKEEQRQGLHTFEQANSEMKEKITSLQAAQDEMNHTLLMLEEEGKTDIITHETIDVGINGDFEEAHEVVAAQPMVEGSFDLGLTPGLVEHVEEYVEQPSYFATALQEMNQIISETKHELAEAIFAPCDFVYEGNCYFSEVHYYKKTDYADAETICASRHATVAYPLSKEHFNQLLYNTRTKMPEGLRYVYVWIGLKQNPETGEVTTPGLEAAPYLKWYSGQPSKRSDETRVYLYVTKDARDGRQGMFDDYDGYEFHGAICQYGFPPLNDQELATKRAGMDWHRIQSGGQLFSYKLFLKKVSYKTAQQECTSLGAGLASTGMRIPAVRSEVINTVVRHGGEDTWLGLDNFQTPGQWTWNDGVEATDDNTNWFQDGVSASQTQCGVIRQGSVYKFATDNGACWLEHFYLCEKIA